MSFYEKIFNYYEKIFPLKRARIDFISSYLKDKYLNVLDIGCATGELAIALSKIGYRVTGIDLDENMVKAAQLKVVTQGGEVKFFGRDMLNVGEDFTQNSFDAVLCFGNTLAHLQDLKQIQDFFLGLNKILKKGGKFFLQVVNFERILREDIKELPRLETETFSFERKYNYDSSQHRIKFNTCLFLKKSGESIKSLQLLYPLTSEELKRALASTGFSKFRFLENENGLPFTETSPGLISVSHKD